MCTINAFRIDDALRAKRTMDLVVSHFAEQCSSKVSYVYGKHQVKKADYILLASSVKASTRSKKNITKVCGFVLLQHQKSKREAYIDVVCSKSRFGQQLIREAETFARSTLNCKSIRLSALPHVISYYQNKHAYMQTDHPCIDNPRIRRKGTHVNGYRMTKCLTKNQI